MRESCRVPETGLVFAGLALYSRAQRLSSGQVGWGLLALLSVSADTFCLSRIWCCCISTKVPVFLLLFGGKKEPASCTKTISIMRSCDRRELIPFYQVIPKAVFISGAQDLTQASSGGKSCAQIPSNLFSRVFSTVLWCGFVLSFLLCYELSLAVEDSSVSCFRCPFSSQQSALLREGALPALLPRKWDLPPRLAQGQRPAETNLRYEAEK